MRAAAAGRGHQAAREPLTAALEAQLQGLLDEAAGLRFGVEMPRPDAGPSAVLEVLLAVRARVDRLEAISGQLLRFRGMTRRNATASRNAADDAWDSALSAGRSRAARAGGDGFVAPRERYADANLETIREQREARRAEELASHAEDAYEVTRMAVRGMDGLRADLLAMVRALQFESHLERAAPERGF